MAALSRPGNFSRRRLLLGAAASCLPFPALAAPIYTPRDLMEQYRREVTQRLHVPGDEVGIYGSISDLQLFSVGHDLLAPQYLLVVDSNPHVQAAFLFWRLVAGSYDLVGASPVSTGSPDPGGAQTPQGLFEQMPGGERRAECTIRSVQACSGGGRIYDFGWQRPSGIARHEGVQLQLRGANRGAERLLGTPCSDGCIVLPASLIAFLDEYAVLDGAPADEEAVRRARKHVLPYRGRHLLVVDSERDERPPWSPAPAV